MLTKEGRRNLLAHLTQFADHPNHYIHLGKTLATPADADVGIADLAGLEADFPGYAPIQASGWSVPTIDGGGIASTDTGVLVWTASALFVSPQTIVCAWITMKSPLLNPFCLWYEVWTPSVTVAAIGEQIKRIFKLQDTNYAP